MISSKPHEHIIDIGTYARGDTPPDSPPPTPVRTAASHLAKETMFAQPEASMPHVVVNIPLEAMHDPSLPQQLGRWAELALPQEQRTLASQRIQEAAAWHATHLDLRHLGLTSLPRCLGTLTHLETLNLTGNRLSRLPDTISNLSNLKHLYCGLNPISQLPNNFEKLEKLESLSLLFHNLETAPEGLSKRKQLKNVELRKNLDEKTSRTCFFSAFSKKND
jgi:hypothetical protein